MGGGGGGGGGGGVMPIGWSPPIVGIICGINLGAKSMSVSGVLIVGTGI